MRKTTGSQCQEASDTVEASDGLAWWIEQYFTLAVTTRPASQRVQRRDLAWFLRYLQAKCTRISAWRGHRGSPGRFSSTSSRR